MTVHLKKVCQGLMNASQGVNLDDAVIAVWKALVYLDYKKLNTKDSKLRYVAFMK